MAKRKAKLTEVNLKFELIDKEAGRAGDLQKELEAKIPELKSAKTVSSCKTPALKKKTRDNGSLAVELGRAPFATCREAEVIYDFSEFVCTGYTLLIRTQASSYRSCLIAVICHAQARRKCPGGFRLRVWEYGLWLHLDDEDIAAEREGPTLCRGTITVVIPHREVPCNLY